MLHLWCTLCSLSFPLRFHWFPTRIILFLRQFLPAYNLSLLPDIFSVFMFYERQTILLLAAFWRFLTIFVYAENFFFFTVKCKMNKKLQLRVLHKGPLARISCHWIQHCWGSLASSFRYPRNVSKGNELCFDLRNCHLRHFFFISRFCITSERKTSSIFDEFTFFVYAVEFVGLAMLNLIEILFFHIGKKALFARVHWMWLCRIIRLSGGKKKQAQKQLLHWRMCSARLLSRPTRARC